MKKLLVILLFVSFQANAIQFPFLASVMNSKIIRDFGTYRAYGTGKFATSCADYKTPSLSGYLYNGVIGNGPYRIQPVSGTITSYEASVIPGSNISGSISSSATTATDLTSFTSGSVYRVEADISGIPSGALKLIITGATNTTITLASAFGHTDTEITIPAGTTSAKFQADATPSNSITWSNLYLRKKVISPNTNFYDVVCDMSGGTTGTFDASGGDQVIYDGQYKVHIFKTIGTSTLTVNQGGTAEVLIVAGGGGGGSSRYSLGGAGGGGAGGLIHLPSLTITPGSYSIVVGGGGNGGPNGGTTGGSNGSNGSASSAFGNSAAGGGGGGHGATCGAGQSGGSGGGAGYCGYSANNGYGSPVNASYGNRGGNVVVTSPSSSAAGAGGGGAGGAGGSNIAGHVGGNPGPGLVKSVTGINITYATGGAGGGGTGAFSGSANTGSGGYGVYANEANGGNGGSGVVIIRYKYVK